jgi:hypothetical protein
MAGRAHQELRADFCSPLQQTRNRLNTCQSAPDTRRPGSRRWSSFAHYITPVRERIVPVLSGAALLAIIFVGWVNREEGYVTPETGLGYWLGIAGASSMLLLLIYPLRKRLKVLRSFGSVTFWFRTHMLLGLAGPTLILFHSNFQLGSVNSNMALFAMLIVAASGLVGRYLYSKIHLGLYGRKAAVREILSDADALRHMFGEGMPLSDRAIAELNAFAKLAMAPRTGALANLWWMSVLNLRTRAARKRLSAEARQFITIEGKRQRWPRRLRRKRRAAAVELIALHLAAVRKAAAFAFYERLFALWHVLHLPLFILLVLAAVIHVVAVHFY